MWNRTEQLVVTFSNKGDGKTAPLSEAGIDQAHTTNSVQHIVFMISHINVLPYMVLHKFQPEMLNRVALFSTPTVQVYRWKRPRCEQILTLETSAMHGAGSINQTVTAACCQKNTRNPIWSTAIATARSNPHRAT